MRARDAPPMIMTDEKGAPTGFEVDHALGIGKQMGVAVEFVRTAETYESVVDVVAREEADIAVSFLCSGLRRAMKELLSKPYITQNHRGFYHRASFARLRSDFAIETIKQLATTEAAKTLEIGLLDTAAVLQRFEERPTQQSE